MFPINNVQKVTRKILTFSRASRTLSGMWSCSILLEMRTYDWSKVKMKGCDWTIIKIKACDWWGYLVEVLVVCPDALVGGLPAPAPALGVMPHDVYDASGRVQRLVDAEEAQKIKIKCVYLQTKTILFNQGEWSKKERRSLTDQRKFITVLL